MSDIKIIPLIGTTNGDGDATIEAEQSVNGLLYGFIEDKGSLADGVDMTLSVVNSELAITLLTLTDANTDGTQYYPRGSSCGSTGTSNSDNLIMLPIVGLLKCVISQGGETKTGGVCAIVLE